MRALLLLSVQTRAGGNPWLRAGGWLRRLAGWIPACAGMSGRVAAGMGGVCLVLIAAPAPAFAAQTVELRSEVAMHDGLVTLGDLFGNAGPAGSIIVASGGHDGGALVLDAARLKIVAEANGLSWANAQGLRRIIARSNAGGGASASASGPVRAAEALVYTRDLATGDVVQPEDLAWSKSPAAGIPLDSPRDSRSVIGQAAKRALRAGMGVSQNDVATPMVIKRDDLVAVSYESDGIKLVLQGKAMGAASAGQNVDIVNPGSKKVIQAVATGPGAAVVGPEADRLRAALGANPQLFASLH